MKRIAALLACLLVPAWSMGQCPDGQCPKVRVLKPALVLPVLNDSLDGGARRDKELKPGDVWIPPEFRIRNRNGNCVWCAAETICLQAGLESFHGMTDRAIRTGWSGAEMEHVLRGFKDGRIDFESERGHDPAILYRAVAANVGCYVQIPGHALVLVGIDDASVRLIDNNGPPTIKVWSRQQFDQMWTGCACFPCLRPRIWNFLHPLHPWPPAPPDYKPPQSHPPLNPAHPVETPTPTVVPSAPGATAPAGPAGPAGPPGKDGASVDTAALVSQLGSLIDTKLAARDVALNARLSAVETKLDDLSGAVRTRFVAAPASK